MAIIGTAHRTTQAEAHRAFDQGKRVLVTDSELHRTEVPVSETTTTHGSINSHDNGTTWARLRSQMLAWGRRQQMYVVTYTPEHLHEQQVAALVHQGCTVAQAEAAIAANEETARKWRTGEYVDLEHSMST